MMKMTEELLEQAKRLPLTERAALVDALLETIDAADPERDAKWSDEAKSRLSAYRSGELPAIDADEVFDSKRR
jgi:putative addiction module component (TIGR02574 family)